LFLTTKPSNPWSDLDLTRYTISSEDYRRLGKLRDAIALCLRDFDQDALLALRLTIAEAEMMMTDLYGSPRDLEAALRASREGVSS
jgi:hypothetical protein